MNADVTAKLRAPFKAEQIGKLPKVTCGDCSAKDRQCQQHKKQKCRVCKAYVSTSHIHIDYVGHAHVTERLLEVDPAWSWEPLALDNQGLPQIDQNGGLWIRLTVGGKTMIGYGDAPGKRAAVKELIGDAIRNAGMRFGIALDLWKKEAPAPVSDVPDRQVERPRQTPEDRAAELRGQIAAMGKAQGKTVQQMTEDFYTWSRGQDIVKASVAVLAEYKEHLSRPQAEAGEGER
jgi:hypothetical protein